MRLQVALASLATNYMFIRLLWPPWFRLNWMWPRQARCIRASKVLVHLQRCSARIQNRGLADAVGAHWLTQLLTLNQIIFTANLIAFPKRNYWRIHNHSIKLSIIDLSDYFTSRLTIFQNRFFCVENKNECKQFANNSMENYLSIFTWFMELFGQQTILTG